MRLEFGDEPPPEICLPEKPLSDIQDDASRRFIQDAPYITRVLMRTQRMMRAKAYLDEHDHTAIAVPDIPTDAIRAS